MKNTPIGVLAAAIVLGLAGAAHGVISTVALYRCGEDGDDPNVALKAAVGTDAAIIYNHTESIVTGTTGARGSTQYLSNTQSVWSPNLTYLYGQANNWGMCAWVQMPSGPLNGSTYVGDNYWMMSNGTFGATALGLRYIDSTTTKWNIGHGDITTVDPSLWGTWAHVALVYNGNSNAQLYVNGNLLGAIAANAAFRNDYYGYFYIGTWNFNNYVGRAAKGFDDVMVFSFQAGAFDISDIYDSGPQPHLTAAPSSGPLLDFGHQTAAGNSSTVTTVTLTSDGADGTTANITSAALGTGTLFAFDSTPGATPVALPKGSSAAYGLRFVGSTTPGTYTDILTITTDVGKFTYSLSAIVDVPGPHMGDINRDEVINLGDFSILKANFSQTGTTWDTGDLNGDSVVNLGDFSLLKAHYNHTGNEFTVPTTAVPEPSCAAALLLGVVGVIRRRRGR